MQSVTFRTHAVKSTVLLTVLGLVVISMMLCSCAKKPDSKSSAGVQGSLLDTPTLFPDGSTRFHIIEDASSKSAEMVSVPAGGISATTLLVDETFDDGKKPDWQDKVGTTTVENGMLVAGNGRNEVILADVDGDLLITAQMKSGLQGGILVHYVDPENYVMAYLQPAQKILAFHNKVGGDWGPSIAAVPVAPIADPRVRMTLKLTGDKAELMLEDSQSQIARTECTLNTLKDSGGIGFYHDASVGDEPQTFDNFQVSRIQHIVPANAVQVVIPADVMGDDFVWTITDTIQVKGVEGSGRPGALSDRRARFPHRSVAGRVVREVRAELRDPHQRHDPGGAYRQPLRPQEPPDRPHGPALPE